MQQGSVLASVCWSHDGDAPGSLAVDAALA